MMQILGLLRRLLDLLSLVSWLPPLLARVTVGVIFLQSGWGKLHNLEKVTGFFASLGLPAPGFQAPLVAGTEFVAGILLIAGLATRLASIPLMIIMVVALSTALRGDIHGFGDLAGSSEFLYLLLLFWLAVHGAGLLSLDTLLSRKLKQKLD
jgi:putative oxidoreductase